MRNRHVIQDCIKYIMMGGAISFHSTNLRRIEIADGLDMSRSKDLSSIWLCMLSKVSGYKKVILEQTPDELFGPEKVDYHVYWRSAFDSPDTKALRLISCPYETSVPAANDASNDAPGNAGTHIRKLYVDKYSSDIKGFYLACLNRMLEIGAEHDNRPSYF